MKEAAGEPSNTAPRPEYSGLQPQTSTLRTLMAIATALFPAAAKAQETQVAAGKWTPAIQRSAPDIVHAPKLVTHQDFEHAVEKGELEFPLQIAFVKNALRKNGPYHRLLSTRPRSEEEEQMRALAIKNIGLVSSRMTERYANGTLPAELSKRLDLRAIEEGGVKQLPFISKKNTRAYANGFFAPVRDEEGKLQPLFFTSGHVVTAAKDEKIDGRSFFKLVNTKRDLALRPAPNEIHSIEALPEVDMTMRDDDALGQVGFYVGYDHSGKRQAFLSFVMPKTPEYSQAVPEDAFMLFTPPQFAKVGVASSFSGGWAGFLHEQGIKVLGPMMRHSEVAEDCKRVCYSGLFVPTLSSTQESITAARAHWAAEAGIGGERGDTIAASLDAAKRVRR